MDKNKTSKSVAARIFLFSMAVGGVTVMYANIKVEDAFWDHMARHLYSIGEARAEQVNLFLGGKQNRAVDFSSDGFIKDSLYKIKNGENTKEAAEKLRAHLIVNKLPVDKSFYKVLALGASGAVVASTDKESVGLDMSGDPVFMEGRSRPYVKNLSYDSVAGVKSLVLSAPVLRNNEFVGVIAIKMLPDILMDIMTKKSDVGERFETYIINKDGYLVTPSAFLDGENRGILTQLVDSENSKNCLKKIERNKANNNGEFFGEDNELVNFVDFRGEDVIGTYYIIPSMNWCLLAEAEKAEVSDDRWGRVATVWAVLIAGSFIAALIELLIAGQKTDEHI